MKNTFLIAFAFVAGLSFQSPAFAAKKMNCTKFSKEADKLKLVSEKKQKQLETLNVQYESGTKAIDKFNKNCRNASGPNCNPIMFNMISGQMNMLAGQRQKLMVEVKDAMTKSTEAIKDLRACNSVILTKTVTKSK